MLEDRKEALEVEKLVVVCPAEEPGAKRGPERAEKSLPVLVFGVLVGKDGVPEESVHGTSVPEENLKIESC